MSTQCTQMVSQADVHGVRISETDWPTNEEDPEHQLFNGYLNREEPPPDLFNSDADFARIFPTEISEIQAGDGQVGSQEDALLDSAEFQEALEDLGFRADLKRACQWAFNRHSQRTHSSWEDLQQEVLMRFGRWLPYYRKEAKRKSVFGRIATNLLIDAHRCETSKRRQHEEINFDELDMTLAAKSSGQIEDRIFIDECRAILSKDEREIFDDFCIKGKSLREIAVGHGVSATAMSKKWARMMRKLRDR